MTEARVAPGSAGSAIVAALAATALQLADASAGAARDEPDAVHRARITTRRLRSVLGAHRGLFDRVRVRALRDLLEEFGDRLGEVRDLEVRLAQAEERLGPAVDAAIRRRLVDEVRARHAAGSNRLRGYLDGRGREVQRAMVDFVTAPPFVVGAAGDAVPVLAAMLRAEAKRVRRAARRATGDLESLHALRRAVRRLRYAAEAVSEPPAAVFGEEVRELADRAQLVQDRLGAHRDELLFAAQVRALAVVARSAGESTGAYETLAADAFATAAASLEGLDGELRVLRRSIRWLRRSPSKE
ncbi:CHAD domain-containing protein [Agromyces soli]